MLAPASSEARAPEFNMDENEMDDLKEGEEFDSFEDFEKRFKLWCANSSISWVVSSSKTVAATNKTLSAKVKPIPDRFKFRNITYICKHGGDIRTTGRGLRPHQSSFKQGCPGRVFLSVDREKEKLVIVTVNLSHNHEISREIFRQYPGSRHLAKDDVDKVETMLQLGVKVKYLRDHIQSTGSKFITNKDIHNIRQGMKKRLYGAKSEEEILLDELQELGARDPGAFISVQTSEEGTLEYLLIVTSEMREVFQRFPEILMIDSTYGTNTLKMPLFSLLVEDGNGVGQTVGYAFIGNEKKFTMASLMSEFSRIHNIQLVKVVVLDKDMSEIGAVQDVMPHATIQLCKFHVLQAVRRHVSKLSIDTESKEVINKAFRSVVYAKTRASFKRAVGHLTAVSTDDFIKYYHKNWGTCKKFWAYYLTMKHINLGNTTNNRMESHNQKIKDVLDRQMTLSTCVRRLLIFHDNKMAEMKHKEFNQPYKTQYVLGDSCPTKDLIVKTVTPYSAGIIINELDAAKLKTSRYARDGCHCPMKETMELPCRHTFAKRLVDGQDLFSCDDVSDRWLLTCQLQLTGVQKIKRIMETNEESPVLNEEPSQHLVHISKRTKPSAKTKTEKYKEIMFVCQSIADLSSTQGTREFNEKYDTLVTLYKLWLENKKVLIVPSEETENNSLSLKYR